MKKTLFFVFLFVAVYAFSAETIHRNILWTLEGKNDPIVQLRNESEDPKTVTIRILIGTSSYRYPSDLEIPPGENQFVRIQEVIETIGRRYPELTKEKNGLLQIEYEGVDDEIRTRLVNLNPKIGMAAEKDSDRTPVPAIDTIDPRSGNSGGGTVVTIVGKNFTDSTSVRFGGVPALHNRQSADVLIAVTPAHSVGSVDVEVSNGKHAAKLARAFDFQSEGPVILDVKPEKGPSRGGTAIKITGRNFQPGISVLWNGSPINTRYMDATSLAVVAPAGEGSITIEVKSAEGKSFKLPDAFAYEGTMRINSVSPQLGSTAGGYLLTINGENFEQGSSVLFGKRYGPTTFINPQTLAATVPSGTSGPVDISVTTSDGQMVTAPQAFLYDELPRIHQIKVDPNPVVRLTTTTITVDADDPEGGPLDYVYEVTQSAGGCTVAGHGSTATFSSSTTAGTATVEITVTDQYGGTVTGNVTVTVN